MVNLLLQPWWKLNWLLAKPLFHGWLVDSHLLWDGCRKIERLLLFFPSSAALLLFCLYFLLFPFSCESISNASVCVWDGWIGIGGIFHWCKVCPRFPPIHIIVSILDVYHLVQRSFFLTCGILGYFKKALLVFDWTEWMHSLYLIFFP